jgi:hypothetical protein
MFTDDDHLSKARRHVEDGRRSVWELKGRIARLKAAGFDTLDAARTLRLLEANLRVFQEHKSSLEHQQVKRFTPPIFHAPK